MTSGSLRLVSLVPGQPNSRYVGVAILATENEYILRHLLSLSCFVSLPEVVRSNVAKAW